MLSRTALSETPENLSNLADGEAKRFLYVYLLYLLSCQQDRGWGWGGDGS